MSKRTVLKSGGEAGVGGIGFRDGGAGGTPLPRQQATGPRLRDTSLNQAPPVAQLERRRNDHQCVTRRF
ncbi:hypothetical protein PR003_g33223 [Phytophthora rubi]|uniref:Uncharacterized protein n=1 Tax=Phytophthora rubi TaxID=129364 RepID=A0A6A4ASP8_9STRA|nr:hypothetical protein PR003_g33223 [Phytophthora rubi]